MVRICHPLGDGISSVDNLLDSVVLRVAIWLVAVTTCTGNAFVIVCRLLLHDEHNSHSLFIKNLAGKVCIPLNSTRSIGCTAGATVSGAVA